jgi:hypothetical protein
MIHRVDGTWHGSEDAVLCPNVMSCLEEAV